MEISKEEFTEAIIRIIVRPNGLPDGQIILASDLRQRLIDEENIVVESYHEIAQALSDLFRSKRLANILELHPSDTERNKTCFTLAKRSCPDIK